MTETLFDDRATITVRNAAIHIPHDGPQALNAEPAYLTMADRAQCGSWNGGEGCIFYDRRSKGCIARNQQGLDKVLETVHEAQDSLKGLLKKRGQGEVPSRFRDMWVRNRTLEKLIVRRQLPIRHNPNRTISVRCPTYTFVGDVKVSDDTA